MTGAGILGGDFLAVHRTEEVRTGQIDVARMGDERLMRRGGRIKLLAENPGYLLIVINGLLAIESIVVGLIRGDGRCEAEKIRDLVFGGAAWEMAVVNPMKPAPKPWKP